MSAIEVKVPDIGDFKDVPVIEILVKAGDTIAKEQSLITVESDKASMDVPSTSAGMITEVLLKKGDKVSKGTVIAQLDSNAQGTGGEKTDNAGGQGGLAWNNSVVAPTEGGAAAGHCEARFLEALRDLRDSRVRRAELRVEFLRGEEFAILRAAGGVGCLEQRLCGGAIAQR